MLIYSPALKSAQLANEQVPWTARTDSFKRRDG